MKILASLILMVLPLLADEPYPGIFHVSGQVIQKLPDGYLVRAQGPIPIPEGRPVDFSSPEWKASQKYTPEGVRILPNATILVIAKKDWVDGDAVEINVVLTGEYSYSTVLGAEATIRKYSETELPKPAAPKEKPWNPGSINDPVH